MNNVRKYRETDVNTASPLELILMLYDECVRTLDRTDLAFDLEGPDRIDQINSGLLHAQDVITELAVSLNLEQGGEVAATLHNLYEFMVNHLGEANVKQDRQPVRNVRKMMVELRDSWRQGAAQAQTDAAPPPAAPRRNGMIAISG
jgi:flagellar secretion chaperone FliS